VAVTAKWYGLGVSNYLNAAIDWDTDTIKVSLHTSTYSPNQDTHDFRDDLTNEVSGTGYSAGGAALANKARTYDAASNTIRLDADDLSWTGATISGIRYAVIYKSRGGASSADELLGYVDFGGDQAVSSGTFTIQWDATDGVLRAVVA
jgi:hypothetical protein